MTIDDDIARLRRMPVSLPPDLQKQVRLTAEEEGYSLDDVISERLRFAFSFEQSMGTISRTEYGADFISRVIGILADCQRPN